MATILDELTSKGGNDLASCPSCGCPSRWVDIYGGTHCEVCEPIRRRSLVSRREILLWSGTPSARWEPIGSPEADPRPPDTPFAGYDPFGDAPLPKHIWHPLGDPERIRKREIRDGSPRRCRCWEPTIAVSPCRHGEWLREYCKTCGRTLRILDAI